MKNKLSQLKKDAIWISASLFNRGKTSGSSANISFVYEDRVYISGTGTCFGTLTKSDFSELDLNGIKINHVNPSKEFPLHLLLYKNNPKITAVIHTHSFYTTLWSCYRNEDTADAIPKYTPYLEMKLGKIGWIPYASPGSEELFEVFAARLDSKSGYILRNHGPLVGGETLFSAFFALEELEESARLAWELRNENIKELGEFQWKKEF